MQRLVSHNVVSKRSRNVSNIVISLGANNFLFLCKTTPLVQQHTTYSPSCPKSKNNFGFVSNPLLLNPFVPNSLALFKKNLSHGPNDLNCGVAGRKYHSGSSNVALTSAWSWIQSPDQVVLGLFVTNVVVFLFSKAADDQFLTKHFKISVENFRSGRVYTLLTNAFSHTDNEHLSVNMIGLYLFGISIGRVFGPEFLLILYLSGAVCSSVCSLAVMSALVKEASKRKELSELGPGCITSMGSSGAVYSIMLFDIFTHPRYNLYLDFITPFPAILLAILITQQDFLRVKRGNLGGCAHLGGAAFGVIAALAYPTLEVLSRSATAT